MKRRNHKSLIPAPTNYIVMQLKAIKTAHEFYLENYKENMVYGTHDTHMYACPYTHKMHPTKSLDSTLQMIQGNALKSSINKYIRVSITEGILHCLLFMCLLQLGTATTTSLRPSPVFGNYTQITPQITAFSNWHTQPDRQFGNGKDI